MRLLLLAGALLVASAARADEPDYPVIPEHEFVVVPTGTAKPVTGEDRPLPSLPESTWAQRHLQAGSSFVDPFVGTELYPEVSANTSFGLDAVGKGRASEFRSALDLSLYLLDIHLPLAAIYEGTRLRPPVDLALKIPFAIPGAERNRFALVMGAVVPNAGNVFDQGRAEFLYGWGGPIGFQLKLGYGYQQLFPEQPAQLGALYGLTLGANLGWLEPVVQLEGVHTSPSKSDSFALLPGFNIFPLGDQSLQLSVAGLVAGSKGRDAPAHRAGVVFRMGYNFL